MGGQEIRSWARGLYTLKEIRFDLPRPQFPPYPAFAPFLPALPAHVAGPPSPAASPPPYSFSSSCSSSSARAKTGWGWFARQAEFEKTRFTRQPSQPDTKQGQTEPGSIRVEILADSPAVQTGFSSAVAANLRSASRGCGRTQKSGHRRSNMHRRREERRGERGRWEGRERRRLGQIWVRGPDPGSNASLACHNGNRP